MNILFFIIGTFAGFYSIYKAVTSLDKIYAINKNGIKAKASVIEIREKKQTDSDGDTSYLYYYTVKFRDNRGKEVTEEIDFPVNNKSLRTPPFDVDIIYRRKENQEFDIILETNNGRNTGFYISLITGIAVLSYVIYTYDGQIDIILEFINNLFK